MIDFLKFTVLPSQLLLCQYLNLEQFAQFSLAPLTLALQGQEGESFLNYLKVTTFDLHSFLQALAQGAVPMRIIAKTPHLQGTVSCF